MTIGVCSWSLRPDSPEGLTDVVSECGLAAVQLALSPMLDGKWSASETRRTLEDHGIAVLSTMLQTKGEDYSTLESIKLTGGLRPDEHWDTNLDTVKRAAELVHDFRAYLVTFHAGFLPHDPADPLRRVMIDRIRQVHDIFAEAQIDTALETGQESAETLRELLEELKLPRLGVNFDPANMILYDMGDPVESLKALAPWVKQIHLKDAVRTTTPGQWGSEVPSGSGDVNWAAIFDGVKSAQLEVDMCIEREAGEDRTADIHAGLAHLESIGVAL